MSDDTVVTADAEPKKADVASDSPKPKTYSEEEFKKVVAARDEVKQKLRAIEEAEQKKADEEALNRGEAEKLLAQYKAELDDLRKFRESKRAEEDAERDDLLGKLSDDDKELAMEFTNLAKLRKFVEKQTQAPPLDQGKGGKGNTAKDYLNPKPGESALEYNMRIMREKQSKH